MRILCFILVAALIAACSTPATQIPPATPQVLTVSMTPAVRSWQPVVRACASTIPELRLLLVETYGSRMELGKGFLIRLGTPRTQSPFYAAQIGEEQIAVVVNTQNPLQELSTEALRSLFTGQNLVWDTLANGSSVSVQAWDYPDVDEVHQIFTIALWKSNPPSILAFQAPDPAALLEAITENEGAIGYVPTSWSRGTGLKIVSLESELQTALTQPVLILSDTEPQGLAQNLISCLQSSTK